MKSLFNLLLCSAFSLASFAQDAAGIYYEGAKIPSSRVLGEKLGNLVGAYFSFGLSAAKRDLQIEGKTSELTIHEKKPEFTIVFSKEEQIDTVFTTEDFFDYLVLVRLKEGKNRKLQNGSYGLTGIQSTLSDKYIIALSVMELGNGKYKVKPREELKKGEYAFYFNIQLPTNETDKDGKPKMKPYNKVYDFTIR